MHENLEDWRRIAFQVRHPRHREGDGARPPVPWRYQSTNYNSSMTGTGPWRCSATQVRLPGVHEHLHGGCDLASPLEASAESLQVSMKLEFELEGCSIWEGSVPSARLTIQKCQESNLCSVSLFPGMDFVYTVEAAAMAAMTSLPNGWTRVTDVVWVPNTTTRSGPSSCSST